MTNNRLDRRILGGLAVLAGFAAVAIGTADCGDDEMPKFQVGGMGLVDSEPIVTRKDSSGGFELPSDFGAKLQAMVNLQSEEEFLQKDYSRRVMDCVMEHYDGPGELDCSVMEAQGENLTLGYMPSVVPCIAYDDLNYPISRASFYMGPGCEWDCFSDYPQYSYRAFVSKHVVWMDPGYAGFMSDPFMSYGMHSQDVNDMEIDLTSLFDNSADQLCRKVVEALENPTDTEIISSIVNEDGLVIADLIDESGIEDFGGFHFMEGHGLFPSTGYGFSLLSDDGFQLGCEFGLDDIDSDTYFYCGPDRSMYDVGSCSDSCFLRTYISDLEDDPWMLEELAECECYIR